MSAGLAARTEAGRRLTELAQTHAEDFFSRAAKHDAQGRFVHENFAAMRVSGFLAGTAPTEFGGTGVDSLHDLTVAVSRLARGCPSTAIAANMHLGFGWHISRIWRQAGADAAGSELAPLLKLLGGGQIVISHAGTEPTGRSLLDPATEARSADGGYVINGHKIFATNSEIADIVTVYLHVVDADGRRRTGSAAVPRGTTGMRVADNWDALGMRGSGSHDVVFTDCRVPAEAVRVGGPVGAVPPDLWSGLIAINFPLVGAYLGIAECARGLAVTAAHRKRRTPARGVIDLQIAEIEVELAAARGVLDRAADEIDRCLARSDAFLTMAQVNAAVHEFQCAKLVVNRAAAAVVDRAMSVVGGSAYLTGHPLGRLYRDVRAGPFMAPFSTNDALLFISRMGLGLDPHSADDGN